MARISSFVLQYENIDYAALKASSFDLIITQGDTGRAGNPLAGVTDNQVKELIAQGRTVVGYVNVAVADDNRPYWDGKWTQDRSDLGDPTADAPSWLVGQPKNSFGYIAKFWDPGWQDIVLKQALELVNRGYSGIFFDDTAVYFALAQADGSLSEAEKVALTRELAVQMAQFVDQISQAIRELNPDAYVVSNANPYIVTDVTADARGTAAASAYLGAVNAQLLENSSADTIQYSDTTFAHETRLLLRTTDQLAAFDFDGYWQRGPFYQTATFEQAGSFSYPANALDNRLLGGDGPNAIAGLGGNDVIFGFGGNDRLDGNVGNDRLAGGFGDDTLVGGTGRDVLSGGAGRDTLAGGADADRFVFASGDSGSRTSTADRIADFSALQRDRIDVSAIDANTSVDGNQAFTFIGTAAFTAAGQVRELMIAGKHFIALDWTGDQVADMMIRVDGVMALNTSDFLL